MTVDFLKMFRKPAAVLKTLYDTTLGPGNDVVLADLMTSDFFEDEFIDMVLDSGGYIRTVQWPMFCSLVPSL